MALMDASRFFKHLIALIAGQLVLGAIAGMIPGALSEEAGTMATEVASPTATFVLLACLVYPIIESGILVFFIWALSSMKAHGWLVRGVAGTIFGMMHASFGVGKVVITAYAGIVYSNLFIGDKGRYISFFRLCALHSMNNIIVILFATLFARLNS